MIMQSKRPSTLKLVAPIKQEAKPLSPGMKALRDNQWRLTEPAGSVGMPPDDPGEVDDKKLSAYIAKMQKRPTKKEQQEQEAAAEEMARLHNAHRSKRQSKSPSTPKPKGTTGQRLRSPGSVGVPPDEPMGPTNYQAAADLVKSKQKPPSPQEQAEQERMADKMAQNLAALRNKKDTTS